MCLHKTVITTLYLSSGGVGSTLVQGSHANDTYRIFRGQSEQHTGLETLLTGVSGHQDQECHYKRSKKSVSEDPMNDLIQLVDGVGRYIKSVHDRDTSPHVIPRYNKIKTTGPASMTICS